MGAEERIVEMGLPAINGVVHHGMTKIISVKEEKETKNIEQVFEVKMKIANTLFAEIDKIDFIKVDIEGYESIAFENMKEILQKHKPLVQSELTGTENRLKVIDIMKGLGYHSYILSNNMLKQIAERESIINYDGDFYFTF